MDTRIVTADQDGEAGNSAVRISAPGIPVVKSSDVGAPAPGHESHVLNRALLDSRQRWRDLATLSADIVFETDRDGHFVFVAPEPALGWPSSVLLGQPADQILAEPTDAAFFNPFRPLQTIRKRRAWLRRPDGEAVCVSFAVTPLRDEMGRINGARGIGQDITEQDGVDGAVASALRRSEVIDQILWRIRREVLAHRMMEIALNAAVQALGAEGAVVLDGLDETDRGPVAYTAGEGTASVLPTVGALLDGADAEPVVANTADGRQVIVCASHTRFGHHAGFAIWRAATDRQWDDEERVLVASTTTIIRVILEHEAIQREMARQARTDPLTGLLNRRAFLDEVTRRIDRLERDNLPGTMMFVDLDHFKDLNDRRGHDVGDDALLVVAALLRATVRPIDLVARFGGDEFAIWLDGADDLATAERAERLRLEAPVALAPLAEPAGITMTMSIGIATRWSGRGEDLDSVMQRADQVMYEVKRDGRAKWRVSRPDVTA